MKEFVVLVDRDDNEIGTMEKQKAHVEAALHRAVSVVIVNNKNEMLLQQRALNKYHCPGLWTNASCTHPRKNEAPIEAAYRRLYEEMNVKTLLNKVFDFVYKAEFDNGLTEHEFDHVFLGVLNFRDEIIFNTNEVNDYKWVEINKLKSDVKTNPKLYTPWFIKILDKITPFL